MARGQAPETAFSGLARLWWRLADRCHVLALPRRHRRNIRAARVLLRRLTPWAASHDGRDHARLFGYLRKIDPFLFEELVLEAFARRGHRVRRNRRYTGDGGIDGRVLAHGVWCPVQCKRYGRHIDRAHVDEFARLRGPHPVCWFVHTGRTGAGVWDDVRFDARIRGYKPTPAKLPGIVEFQRVAVVLDHWIGTFHCPNPAIGGGLRPFPSVAATFRRHHLPLDRPDPSQLNPCGSAGRKPLLRLGQVSSNSDYSPTGTDCRNRHLFEVQAKRNPLNCKDTRQLRGLGRTTPIRIVSGGRLRRLIAGEGGFDG